MKIFKGCMILFIMTMHIFAENIEITEKVAKISDKLAFVILKSDASDKMFLCVGPGEATFVVVLSEVKNMPNMIQAKIIQSIGSPVDIDGDGAIDSNTSVVNKLILLGSEEHVLDSTRNCN